MDKKKKLILKKTFQCLLAICCRQKKTPRSLIRKDNQFKITNCGSSSSWIFHAGLTGKRATILLQEK